MNIVELRRQQTKLADRFEIVHTAIETIFGVTTIFTEALAKASANSYVCCFSHREGHEHDDPPDYDANIGKEMLVADDDFFFPLVNDPVQANNILYELKAIRKNSQAISGVAGTDAEFWTPSEENWLPEEIETVKRFYRRRITDATEKLRDINTTCYCLNRQEAVIPSFVKSALTGLFGVSDHNLGFEYTDIDFKWQAYGKKPKIMTARFLAPFIGLEKANIIETALRTITEVSKPLLGEPPTLTGFGSHSSNRIKLFGADSPEN